MPSWDATNDDIWTFESLQYKVIVRHIKELEIPISIVGLYEYYNTDNEWHLIAYNSTSDKLFGVMKLQRCNSLSTC